MSSECRFQRRPLEGHLPRLRRRSRVDRRLGWLIGVPLGWLPSRGFVAYILSVFDVRIAALFPLGTVALVGVATVAGSALIVLIPVRRGTHLHPGDTLRYV